MSARQFQRVKNDTHWLAVGLVTDLGEGPVPFVTSRFSGADGQSFMFECTLSEKLQSKTKDGLFLIFLGKPLERELWILRTFKGPSGGRSGTHLAKATPPAL